MSFVWKVLVFERTLGREIQWHTLGLGRDLTVSLSARHRSRLNKSLRDALRKRIKGRSGLRLSLCRTAMQAQLVNQHLELRLKGKNRRRWEGTCPMVVETLPGSPTHRIVYPPSRPQDWMLLTEEETRPDLWLDRLRLHLAGAWAEMPDDRLEDLRSQRRDRLSRVSVDLERPSLASQLKKKNQSQDQKVGAGRRRESVLANLAVDESDELRYDGEATAGRRRPEYADRLLQRLREPMTPTVLIGPAGCGKSTLIRRLALDLMREDGFDLHQELGRCRRVYRLAGRRLIAGMSYVGQWEQRCLDLLTEIKKRKRMPILWLEDLHAMGRIGQSRDSRRCLADVFRGPVARGELMIVGESTAEAWQVLEEEAPGFAALFRPLWIRPPSHDEALGLLLHEGRQQELEDQVQIWPSAYRAILETTSAVFGDEGRPARSLDVLRSLTADSYWDSDGAEAITAAGAIEVLARETGLPQVLLQPETALDLPDLKHRLTSGVRGQEEAVAAVVDLIARLKAGLTDGRRPFGVFLFTGPTGTGKTELTKYLAAWLYGSDRRLLRFDMGEHADPWSAGRLVGDRFQPQGLLTEAVRAQPFSVVLLDEIEKAHPSVLNLLLQVFDEGRLTDAAGKVASFTHTVIVMTSNLGAENRSRVGFGSDPNAILHEIQRAVTAFFPPELYNRIDRVVPFRPLTPEIVREIAEAELKRLLSRRGLVGQGLFISADDAVVERVTAEGFSAEHGARAVKRYLDREVAAVLSEALAGRGPGPRSMLRLFAPEKVQPGEPRFAVHLLQIEEAAPLAGESTLEELLSMPPAKRQEWAAGPLLQRVENVLARLRDGLAGEPSDNPLVPAGLVIEDLSIRDQLLGALQSIAELLTQEAERLFPDEGELWEAETATHHRIVHYHPVSSEVQWVRLANPRLGPEPISAQRVLAAAVEAEILLNCCAGIGSQGSSAGELLEDDVMVDLAELGDGDARTEFTERLVAQPPSLLHWLAEVYLRDGLELAGFAAQDRSGKIIEGEGRASIPAALRTVLKKRPRRVVLHLRGLAAWQRLAREEGCHELRGERGRPELVSVQVRAGSAAEAWLGQSLKQENQFLDALRSGAGLEGADLFSPLPLVRRIYFDPLTAESITERGRKWALAFPETGCPPTDCEVEDFRLCMSVKQRVDHLAEALSPLRRRLQTWQTEVEPTEARPTSDLGGEHHG